MAAWHLQKIMLNGPRYTETPAVLQFVALGPYVALVMVRVACVTTV